MVEGKKQRLWELDALRGIAIILMVLFHTVYDLEVFFGWDKFGYNEGFWFYEGRVAALLFIMLVGVASSLIAKRYSDTQASVKNSYRALRLIGLGLLITVTTFFFDRSNTIWFGILHFLGLSILISIPLAKYKWTNVFLALAFFASYYHIRTLLTNDYFGLIFGIMPPGFTSHDHYALIPWLGYVLLGIALGNWIYKEGKPIIKRGPTKIERAFMITGRYSLWIYLIHQPIILGLLWILLV